MPRYDDSILESVISSASIVDEFEALGVKTQRRGRSGEYSALCPFHDDHNPSLSINDEKSVYYCPACGARGDIFGLLMGKKGFDFREAVEYLARKAGIDTAKYNRNYGDPQQAASLTENLNRLTQANQIALEYFQSVYHRTEKAKEYLKGRGLENQTISAFQIGYGGDGSRGLLEHLKEKGYSFDEAVTFGLAGKNDSGEFYDFFRGRIIFPVMDRRGRVAGFSGRALNDDKARAKYLNTKETVLFKKESLLYGYHENAQAIRELHVSILVEGFMDVIGLWQAGVRFVLAPMGTALSEKHAELVRRAGAERVFTMFDPDQAGIKAGVNAAITLSGKAETYICTLPEGKDPDEIALEGGAGAIEALCDSGVGALEHISKDIEASFLFISKEPSEIKREKHLKRIAELHDVPLDAVRRDFQFKTNQKKPAKEETAADGESYEGKQEWPICGGASIVINKNFQMFIKKEYTEKNKKTGEDETKPDWEAIQSTHAIIPKYVVRIGEEEDKLYVLECRRARSKPILVSIPEERFGEPVKLQNALTKAGVAIQVGRTRMHLHAYAIDYAVEVKSANVGVNYTAYGSFIAGYDYILKDGRYYPAKDNIVKINEKEIYYITGYNLKRVNESSLLEKYSRTEIAPDGKIQEFLRKADKLFHTKEKSRITMAFMASAMLREKLVKRFEEVPSLNFYGETPSVGKTTFLDALSAISNTEKHRAKITEHQLYTLQEHRANGVILIDDMRPVENYIGFLKDAASNSYRPRRNSVDGKLNNPQIRNSVFMTTNHSISMSSEADAEALESRVINVRFDKEDTIFSHKAYKDLKRFLTANAFDIYVDLYQRISAIDLDSLESRIDEIEDEIVKIELKSSRIIKLWAILLACGEAVGIKMNPKQYMGFIEKAEGEKLNKSDLYAAAILECAVSIERDSKPDLMFRTRDFSEIDRRNCISTHTIKTDGGQTLYEPPVLLARHFIKLDDLTDFFRSSQMTKDFSQEFVLKELYNLTWLTKHKNAHRCQYIKGEKKTRSGTYLEVNFGHEIFKKAVGIDRQFAYLLPPDDLTGLNSDVSSSEF